jgi:hypothetical protein
MSLLIYQSALARTYLDANLRRAVRAGDQSALAEFNLSPDEFRHIQQLICDQARHIDLFATTLQRKRVERLDLAYKLLRGRLGPNRWKLLCDQYCARVAVQAFMTAEQDCARFGAFAKENLDPPVEHADRFEDLLTFERTKAEVDAVLVPRYSGNAPSDPLPAEARPCLASHACLRVLRYQPQVLADWANGVIQQPVPESAPVHLIFFRRANGAEVSVMQIGRWLAALLARADGRATLPELIEQIASLSRQHMALPDVWKSMTALASTGIIVFSQPQGEPS